MDACAYLNVRQWLCRFDLWRAEECPLPRPTQEPIQRIQEADPPPSTYPRADEQASAQCECGAPGLGFLRYVHHVDLYGGYPAPDGSE